MAKSDQVLDLKDRKILFQLGSNSRKSYSEIARAVGLSQEVVFHRVEKLKKRGIIKFFQTVVSTSKLGFIAPKIYLQLQNINKEKYKELYDYLLDHKKVFWFGVCQGRWDLIIAFFVRDSFEFGNVLDDLMDRFSGFILERQITFGRNSFQFSRRWMFNDASNPMITEFGSSSGSYSLDPTDREILLLLAGDSRMPVVEIARRIKSTANIVHYRIRKLEKDGIISGYRIAMDPHLLGYETCKALIYFKNINQKKLSKLLGFCKGHENILNIVLCVGSWDMEIEFEVTSFDQFYHIMDDMRNRFSDIIKNYESVVFREEPKQIFYI